MLDRKKNLLALGMLLALLIFMYAEMLFTDKIIRAPDIISEYYWGVLELSKKSFLDFFRISFTAGWDIYGNSGNTLQGGEVGSKLMFLPNLIYYFIPPPTSVAWFILLHFFIGAWGTYCYCRLIGVSRWGALLGGLVFAVAPENASLVNAGHVLKLSTISVAPWAFYLFEKGFQRRRVIFFLSTGFVLALQFFYTHWQIAYYTCLAIGVYGIARSIGILYTEGVPGRLGKLLGLNLVTLVFFLSTVAISLAPLASWSTDTNRGAQSGANEGKGGLQREEAMSWSLPPEELATFIIPGFFGLSRQEAGENPAGIASYYWGRMHFTQTTDYMGLLPWLLLPLPLIFRRDRYTWLALAAIAGGIIFSMGKYSLIYNLLFDYFPGIDRFRVPKMMMFIPVMGLGVIAARGIDVLRDESARCTTAFRRYAWGILALPVLLAAIAAVEILGRDYWTSTFFEMLVQPTRYEQGVGLVAQRWNNLVAETWIAAVVAAAYGLVIYLFARRRYAPAILLPLLLALYFADTWRINSKFIFLVENPNAERTRSNPVIDFLKRDSNQYRVLPINLDPSLFATNKVPVMFISSPVQQKRWQDILDTFSFSSAVPDMLNVKYLVYPTGLYLQEKGMIDPKFRPVFTAPDGSQVVLENTRVMPKAWLVPSVVVEQEAGRALRILQDPRFDPRRVALVESPPPLPLAPPADLSAAPGAVQITRYEGARIGITAAAARNSLLVLGEKYYTGWEAQVDGKPADIVPVNHILRGIYLTPGEHAVELRFDPGAFKIGKYLTFASFLLFAGMLVREIRLSRNGR